MKTILFRLDANKRVGLGHLFRSINIAKTFRKLYKQKNDKIIFISSNDEICIKHLKENNFEYFLKKDDFSEEIFLENAIEIFKPHTLFIDKIYPYTANFIKKLKQKTKIILFHNICEGRFEADIFILPSLHTEQKILNDKQWEKTKFFHGKDFICINEKIKILKKQPIINKKSFFKLVITTGGSDPKAVLITLLEYLKDFQFKNLEVIVLVGISFVHEEKLKKIKSNLPDFFKIIPYNAKEFLNADLVISTFGVSTYELLFLNLAIISVAHAELNQKGSKILSEKLNCIIDLGLIDDLSKDKLQKTLKFYLENKQERELLKTKTLNILDGNGEKRIAKIIKVI